MCGICGIVYKDAHQQVDQAAVKRMTKAMVHRGPNDDGFFVDSSAAIGMRRLNVIDPATGQQPMANETKTIWVVLNGEIFNYRELREELNKQGHRFKSASDTEVLVHLYEEYGMRGIKKLNGEFAFALWDAPACRLIVVRDRFGVKPLYYYESPESLSFASELKALMQGLASQPAIDMDALCEYLTFQYIPQPRSIFEGIKKLPPAHILVYEKGKLSLERYWELVFSYKNNKDPRMYIEEIRRILRDSVSSRLIADVPVGAFLSGGIDSSAIVTIASSMTNKPFKTFSVGFDREESSELRYAKIVADNCKTEHTQICLSSDGLRNFITDAVWHLDEPFADSSALPTYLLSKMAVDHVVVSLSGDGGDELFAGYPKYAREALFAKVPLSLRRCLASCTPPFERMIGKAGFWNGLGRTIRRSAMPFNERYVQWGYFFTPHQRSSLLIGAVEKIDSVYSLLEEQLLRVAGLDDLTRMLFVDTQLYLPGDLLAKIDRMSMAHSLEVRVPFLDHRLAELAAQIPPTEKLKQGMTKYILKKSMLGILPLEIIYRKKQGFAVPLSAWLREKLGEDAQRLLTDKLSMSRGYFDTNYIRQLLQLHRSGKEDHSHRIWALLVFEIWHRLYIDYRGNYQKGMQITDLLH